MAQLEEGSYHGLPAQTSPGASSDRLSHRRGAAPGGFVFARRGAQFPGRAARAGRGYAAWPLPAARRAPPVVHAGKFSADLPAR